MRLIGVLLFSLYSGFALAGTDNAAHVGGLTVGFLIGIIISMVYRLKEKAHDRQRLSQAAERNGD